MFFLNKQIIIIHGLQFYCCKQISFLHFFYTNAIVVAPAIFVRFKFYYIQCCVLMFIFIIGSDRTLVQPDGGT